MAKGRTKRVNLMPEYTYVCDACGLKTEVFFTIQDYQETIECSCAAQMRRSYQDDLMGMTNSIVKADSELKTIGDLANRNRDKMSEDHKQALFKKHNAYRENPPEMPLPKNTKRIQKTKGIKWT